MIRTIILLSLTILFNPAEAVAQPAEPLPTLKNMVDAWGKADQFQTVKMVWAEKEYFSTFEGTETKNSYAVLRARMEKSGQVVPERGPLREHTHENQITFWWSKGKWRVERKGSAFPTFDRKPVRFHFTLAFDGKKERKVEDMSPTMLAGKISPEPEFFEFLWLTIGDFLMQLWDVKNSKADIAFAKLEIDGMTRVNGLTVVRATDLKVRKPWHATYTFLPEFAYSIASWERKHEDDVRLRYEAEFDRTLVIPSLPKRWKLENFEEGKLTSSRESFLKSMTVNETFPADIFAIDFPPGTDVDDVTVKPPKRYTVPGKKGDPLPEKK